MSFSNVTPSLAQVTTSESYVSSVDFLSEIHKPDVGETLVKRYGDQSLTGFIDMMGGKKPVANKEFSHYEEDWIHQTFATSSSATEGAGAGVVTGGYILEVESADDAGTTQDERDYTFIRPNAVIEFENGQVALVVAVSVNGGDWSLAEGYTTSESVSAENQTLFICLTYDGLNTGTGTAISDVVSSTVIITGTEFGEGTDQPKGLTPNVIKYENTVMIIKEAYEVTGSEATNAIWFKVEDAATGRGGYLWYLKGEGDTFQRFNDYAEMQMLVGEQVASSATALSSLGIVGTEGLLEFAEGGNSINYSTTFGVDDFRDLVTAIDKNKGSKENTMWSGFEISADIDDAFFNYFGGGTNQGGASFGTFDGGSEKAIQMGFKSFAYGGYTFHKTTYKGFNHTQMLGYATVANGDSKYRTMSLVVPSDSQIDPVTRASVPSLQVRYKEADGYSREMEHWLEGGAVLQNKTSGVDKLKANYRTHRGFEGFAPNRFVLVEK
jgi:hypothetical protein